MLEIVSLVKEKGIEEKCKDELESSISSITESICNAKSIKKEYLFETLQKRIVTSNSDDLSLLTLITVVELSAIQYHQITPIVSSTPIEDCSITFTGKEVAATNVKEDESLKVTIYPQVLDHDILPKFKKDVERIQPTNLSLSRNKTQVG